MCHAFGERLNHGAHVIGTIGTNMIRRPLTDLTVFPRAVDGLTLVMCLENGLARAGLL